MLSDGRIPSDVQTLSPSPNKEIRNMMGQGEATPHTFRYGSASFSGPMLAHLTVRNSCRR